jgi:hypothetical protein
MPTAAGVSNRHGYQTVCQPLLVLSNWHGYQTVCQTAAGVGN